MTSGGDASLMCQLPGHTLSWRRLESRTRGALHVSAGVLLVAAVPAKPQAVLGLTPGEIVAFGQAATGVLRVAPTTGARTVVSSNTVSRVPAFNKPRALALESSGDIPAAVVATAASGIMHQDKVYLRGRIN